MSAERPYQSRPEDVIEFTPPESSEASLTTPETVPAPVSVERTPAEEAARAEILNSLVTKAQEKGTAETQPSSEAAARRREELRSRIEGVLAAEGARKTQEAQEAARQESAEQFRTQKLAALDGEVKDPRKWIKQNPDLQERVLTKLRKEPEWNQARRSKVSWATFAAGGGGVIGGALIPAALSAPVSWPFIIGGGAVLVGGQLIRGGMKFWHSYKEKKHQKAYAEATGRK
jgi:hypothetical protein